MSAKRVWNGAAAACVLLLTVAVAGAQTGACFDPVTCKVATDRPASLLIYPKVTADPANGVDTVIQLASTSDGPVGVRCSYVNTSGHCANNSPCSSDSDCGVGGGKCVQSCGESDFRVTLTRLQPISWNASLGLSFLPCDFLSPDRASCIGRNDGRIPPVSETPFVGELKCIQVDDSDAPVDFNNLIGEATTIRSSGGGLDASRYNAIGVQAIPGVNDHDNNLCIGGTSTSDSCPEGAEYAGCPQTLIMDHFFDGAAPDDVFPVSNRLTLVPCAEDLNTLKTPSISVNFLIFNEFEERISTSLRLRCFTSQVLTDISSVFSLSTQGTVAGQTRITAVGGVGVANGILGLLEESHACDGGPDGVCTAAVNLHQQGRRTSGDVIQIP